MSSRPVVSLLTAGFVHARLSRAMADENAERPPPCASVREQALLRRLCSRAGVEFSEWECARLLTEFKRNLSEAQWASLRKQSIESSEDALRALIVFGFENRRLKRLRLRGRGRDRVWEEAEHVSRMAVLLRRGKR